MEHTPGPVKMTDEKPEKVEVQKDLHNYGTFYSLKINESLQVKIDYTNTYTIIRVPNGLIYENQHSGQLCFVPLLPNVSPH